MNKIYKSRDGLAAVSSNTSIMSELSNISKSSLPSSIPASNQIRHASISSSSSAMVKPPPTARQNSLLALSTSQKPSTAPIPQTPVAASLNEATRPSNQVVRLQSSSSKQQLNNQQFPTSQINKRTTTTTNSSASIQADPKMSAFKKPGQLLVAQNGGNHKLLNDENTNKPISELGGLLISTMANNHGISTSSPASSSASSSKTSKNEAKLNKEVKRLEALCESRTKELSFLKLKLKDTLCSFDAIAVAYNYLANKVRNFNNGLI